MASDSEIAQAVLDQLNEDAAARVSQAGAGWQNQALSFYYGASSASEISVDIAIKKATLRVLSNDHATLAAAGFDDLATSIGASSAVSAAIGKMADVLSHEIFAETDDELVG
jgi:hypothetical protein